MYLSLLRSLNHLHPRAWDFVQLTRIDKPIGIYLLLWPTLWAVWIAGKGSPSLSTLLIFVVGVFLMRAAGCVINDFADRKVDGHVKRTEQRPLVSGRVTAKEALALFAVLVTLSFVLVLFTNTKTVWLSFGGLALAACYPFMKRYTYYPQVVLGAAFSWGMPDREDDLKIGVKSTAVLFGDADRVIILTLQCLALFCLMLAGTRFELGVYFFIGLLVAAGCFAWEFWSTRDRDPQACFKAFLHNHWAGLAIFVGIVTDYALR